MSTDHVRQSRRNAGLMGATAVVVSGLFLFPTSTNAGRPVGQRGASAAGVVGATRATPLTAPRSPTLVVVNGPAADTQYGPVQVQVTMRAGRLSAVKVLIYPQESDLDLQINNYAIPVLEREAVQAQSAQVDSVSGATFTSDGYVRSLQAALDVAHRRA